MEIYTPFDRIFQSCGRFWQIRRANMDALWENMSNTSGEDRLPYWNEVWPSSLALAGWLAEMQEDIKEKQCLDMGCGLGFTALMGQWLGARVTAVDYEAEALEYAKINAVLNKVEGVQWKVMDWRNPILPPKSFERIWAGDVMYEKEAAAPIASFLSFILCPGGRAWIAEPGRDIFHYFLDITKEYNLSFHKLCSLPVFPLTPQEVSVPVTLWEIKKG